MESFYRKYEKVFGYKPSALDLREMERFVTQLGIKENDALLLFFLFQERNLRRLSFLQNTNLINGAPPHERF